MPFSALGLAIVGETGQLAKLSAENFPNGVFLDVYNFKLSCFYIKLLIYAQCAFRAAIRRRPLAREYFQINVISRRLRLKALSWNVILQTRL
jgi:hypothetical protein